MQAAERLSELDPIVPRWHEAEVEHMRDQRQKNNARRRQPETSRKGARLLLGDYRLLVWDHLSLIYLLIPSHVPASHSMSKCRTKY